MKAHSFRGVPITEKACSICGLTWRGYVERCRACMHKADCRRRRLLKAICRDCGGARPSIGGRQYCDPCRDKRLMAGYGPKGPRFCKDCGRMIGKGKRYCEYHRTQRRAATMQRFKANRSSTRLETARLAKTPKPAAPRPAVLRAEEMPAKESWTDIAALALLREFEETHNLKSAATRLDDRIKVGMALMRRRGMQELSSSETRRGVV